MTDTEMASPPGLSLHGKSWRIVKRIPKDLLPHYAGNTHLRFPIDAATESAARVIAWRWHAETEETFARNPESGPFPWGIMDDPLFSLQSAGKAQPYRLTKHMKNT